MLILSELQLIIYILIPIQKSKPGPEGVKGKKGIYTVEPNQMDLISLASSTLHLMYRLTKLCRRGMDAEKTAAEKQQRRRRKDKKEGDNWHCNQDQVRYYSGFLTCYLFAEESHSGTV